MNNNINNEFEFKLYLNAKHAVMFNNNVSGIHNHTFEIVVKLTETDEELNQFNKVEKIINDYLKKYEGKVLNDIYPFTRINPTSENMCRVFYEEIDKLIEVSEFKDSYDIYSTSVLENPTRAYTVKKISNYKDSLESDKFEEKMTEALNAMRNKENTKKVEDGDLSKTVDKLHEKIETLEKERENNKRKNVLIFFGLIIMIITVFLLDNADVINVAEYIKLNVFK